MRLLALLAFVPCLLAQRAPIVIGFTPPTAVGGVGTCNLIAASAVNQCALGFVVPSDKTLNEVRVYFSVVTGTPGTNVTATLYANNAGNPTGALLDGPFNVGSTLAGGAGFYDFTGFTYNLIGGTQYWIVFKNTDGTPASNGATLRHGNTGTGQIGNFAVTGGFYGWMKKQSGDSGTGWAVATSVNIAGSMRLKFSDTTYAGLPISNAEIIATTYGIYGSGGTGHEAGTIFTTPAGGPTLNVRCIAAPLATNGTPTGTVRFKLYTGSGASPTLTATTAVIPVYAAGTAAYASACFTTVQAVAAGATIRLVAAVDGSDAVGNRYIPLNYVMDDTAASKALTPFGGSKATYSTDGGATFTDTDTSFLVFAMVLDQTTPFTVTAGGGTRVYPNQ